MKLYEWGIVVGFLISMIGIYDDLCVSLEGFPWHGMKNHKPPISGVVRCCKSHDMMCKNKLHTP